MWYDIADSPITLKNSAACSLSSDCIYLFGGYTDDKKSLQQTKDYTLSNKIFQYIIAANTWIELSLKLPLPIALATPIKLNNYQIAIFGGQISREEFNRTTQRYQKTTGICKDVLVFDIRYPSIRKAKKCLYEPFISISPPFYDKSNNRLLLVNEITHSSCPKVVQYQIDDI